jgi:hypothetical protein
MTNFEKPLAHALQNRLNVMLIGKHGVGKTAIVKKTFEDAGLNWKYFSASTMDPWVDFIGVPKEKTDPNTGETYLDLVRPQAIANDEVEAIFFDELNRSHKKIRNAIMELIQFGSINGKQFPNLKVIWAAINPDDDEEMSYDVEKMDPAQMDRFQVQIEVPYKPDMRYFREKYGDMGESAVLWWNEQATATKDAVSPRRLDYAVNMVASGGDVRYVFNSRTVNVSQFLAYITRGNPEKDLEALATQSESEKREFFADHNNLSRVMSSIVKSPERIKQWVQYFPEEEILASCKTNKRKGNKIANYIASNPGEFPQLEDTLRNNPEAYSREIVSSFVRHKVTQQAGKQESKNDSVLEKFKADMSTDHANDSDVGFMIGNGVKRLNDGLNIGETAQFMTRTKFKNYLVKGGTEIRDMMREMGIMRFTYKNDQSAVATAIRYEVSTWGLEMTATGAETVSYTL